MGTAMPVPMIRRRWFPGHQEAGRSGGIRHLMPSLPIHWLDALKKRTGNVVIADNDFHHGGEYFVFFVGEY
ncbi:hypothetical protein [Ralstonia pseudosolanacearum]|uniref:Uncharacterized protein n=1 Tax=Ralstonia solanacearum TaxID=305 RepID=A0AA92IFE1_RALSL|nr:hypothetical protein [Ralstonia pseudosolanacearum]QCX50940.1 hypothetical protein E7Z57_17540 [Ralstonia pseudosolanacearum]